MTESERAQQLVLVAQGDCDALQRLMVHYQPQLRAVVDARIEGHLRRHLEPDDVLQRTYIDAFRSVFACSFDSPGGFYKWLEKICLNRLKDAMRDLKRDKRDVGRELHDDSAGRAAGASSYAGLLGRIPADDTSPSRRLAKAEASAALMTSLARLSDDRRAVIELRFLQGHSVARVAADLGKTEAAVHTLTHRALKDLREIIGSITRYLSRL